MRLVELVAEWNYLRDNEGALMIAFREQESHIRDFYFRIAYNDIPELIAGYLKNNGVISKRIRGSIKSFLDAHGQLTEESIGSLEKRITSGLR